MGCEYNYTVRWSESGMACTYVSMGIRVYASVHAVLDRVQLVRPLVS